MKWLGAALAALTISIALPSAASAKSCSAGYKHAVIGEAQKCLRRGEYCSYSERSQYRKYSFVCEDVDGTYRLEPEG